MINTLRIKMFEILFIEILLIVSLGSLTNKREFTVYIRVHYEFLSVSSDFSLIDGYFCLLY